MAWFRKKADPLSARARALDEEIAQLEAQIKKLDARVPQDAAPAQPRLRSTAVPAGAMPHALPPPSALPPAPAKIHEPIFERVDQDQIQAPNPDLTRPEHYNELGVRKYDLPDLMRRVRNNLRGPSTTNPKLVNYLAAGGIQGLRPLRYEKRIARNRFIAFFIILFFTLLGLTFFILRRR